MTCRDISAFEKLNRIEEGTFGIVYRARDLASGQIVAIKKLKLEREREGFPVTSLREITALMKLDHPNIVKLREMVVGKELDGVYIVMEFVEHDLRGLLEMTNSATLQMSEIKTIIGQILSAVAFMHENWIIHRDLKTSNILFTNDGQVKIADFGLARSWSPDVSDSGSLTPVVVTLWYRAPEILLGDVEYSAAIDVWSVGCILGELLLGQPLFPGQGEIDQLDRIVKTLGAFSPDKHPHLSKLPHFSKLKRQAYTDKIDLTFPNLTASGRDLLRSLLALEPKDRITAREALNHPFFKEQPLPKDPKNFPTWPSLNEKERKRRRSITTPPAPVRPQVQD
jgi:cell division cycle 2-like